MRTAINVFFFTLIAIAAFQCQPPEKVSPIASARTAELDSFLSQIQHTFAVPGLAVAVVKDQHVYYKTVGNSDHVSGTPLTATTPFFTGNLSELMTATAVLRLAQQGKLNLEDPVVKHLPYFKLGGNTYTKIQIKHLLTHTSGVPHHDALWDLPTYDSMALEATTRSVSLQQPEFSVPGSRVKRSQYNYDIVADLVSKVSGLSFEEYVKHDVLEPLGMSNSAYYATAINNQDVAKPHAIGNWLSYTLTRREDYPHNREHAGSIGWHASAKDISSWMSMLVNDGIVNGKRFLDKNLFKELLAQHYKTGAGSSIGLGWEIIDHKGSLHYSKTHYIGGFCADITLIPQQGAAVMVMSNISDELDPTIISDQILQWLLNERTFDTPKPPVNIALGRMLEETKSLDATLAHYAELKQQQPDRYDFSHAALSKLGINLLHRLNRKEDALRVFDFIIQQHPSSPYAHLNLAEAYVVSKEVEKAEEELKIVKDLALSSKENAFNEHVTYLEETIAIMKEKNPEVQSEDYYSN